MRLGPIARRDRPRLAELLAATGAFNPDEIQVALSLFDVSLSEKESPRTRDASVGASRRSDTDEVSSRRSDIDELSSRRSDIDEVSSRRGDSSCRDPLAPAEDYEFLGAFDDESDRLIGYACFGATPATDGTYDLYWLAVDPSAQGRGIGSALVRAVEAKLLDRGARLLVVETSSRPDYEGTRRFYARSGYKEAARVRDFYAPADDRIVLTTRLTTR
jgi:GNAT superfamily N-acetyltransferase